MLATMQPLAIPLGASVPALTPHAISVSLPTWHDNVGYEEGEKRVVDRMETGYPRFFIHRSIQKLASICISKFGRPDEACILLPSPTVAIEARDFLASQTPSESSRIVEFVICPSLLSSSDPSSSTKPAAGVECIELQILLFHESHFSTAKAFWQHSGDYISSRQAERALAFLGETPAGIDQAQGSPLLDRAQSKSTVYSKNRHYSKKGATATPTTTAGATPHLTNIPETTGETVSGDHLTPDLTTYLEERYGRNFPLFNAPLAKQAIKRRIVGGLLPSDEDFGKVEDVVRGAGVGGKVVVEDDVYLYPCGMSAIWHAFDIARKVRRAGGKKEGKSVCYGFPYTDTYKILSKWGPGCEFFGQGGIFDLPGLEALLEERSKTDEPILSLFCEFPSNPLLRTPDLKRIRELADQHGFIVVVDETIGNFINVEIAHWADIVVSSLSKVFSGDANVMGGSLVLNPNGPYFTALKGVLATDYEDNYYPEDAVYMERNSRDYRNRIKRINDNTYDICEYLYSRCLEDTTTPSTGKVIKSVYYPRYSTPEQYEIAKRLPTLGKGGYGGLFSVTFTSMAASKAFFDNLACAKGPSLGTSFTLACPYTILAHYMELGWAAEYGVEAGLVRVSVGQEDTATLREWFEISVKAAEEAGRLE